MGREFDVAVVIIAQMKQQVLGTLRLPKTNSTRVIARSRLRVLF